MVLRLARILLASLFALAAVLPMGAWAMPMSAGMGRANVQHCSNCPDPGGSGPAGGKMPACQLLACPGAVATLPTPVLLPARIVLGPAYLTAAPTRWTAAPSAPDPFPPRPATLV
jgi:hypothetical protein